MTTLIPKVGERYVATDNAAACQALGLGMDMGLPLIFVSVSHVYPEHRKVKVLDGELWLTFDDLATHFRLRNADGVAA